MNIKWKVWLGTAISILAIGGLTTIACLFLDGVPLALSLVIGLVGLLVGAYLIIGVHRDINNGMHRVSQIVHDMAHGSVNPADRSAEAGGEFGQLAQSFRSLAVDLYHKTEEERILRLKAEEQTWINVHVSEMAILLQGSVQIERASEIFIGKLASSVQATYGALYVQRDDMLHFAAGYAYKNITAPQDPIAPGIGLVGQCARDKNPILLHDLPDGYVTIHSALGETKPKTLIIVPVLYEDEVVAVIELASLREFTDKERQLIEQTSANMGILLNTLADIARIGVLLHETQLQKEELETQTEELQAQTEELQMQAEELESQTEELQAQTEELQMQADSLYKSNEQLQDQMRITELQKEEIKQQADDLKEQADELFTSNKHLQEQMELTEVQKTEIAEQAEELKKQAEELSASNEYLKKQVELTEQQKIEIKEQADEIFMAAQYKSEFLANVSHELRTPLNSLLILSQILAENKEGNLEARQLEYIHTIFSAGKDLLTLIDEILDLAKLEVGKMTAVVEPVYLKDISSHFYRHFEQQAREKNIEFDIYCDNSLPESFLTDGHRLQQILNNLLSNALKFTETGSVKLSIHGTPSPSSPYGKDGKSVADEIVFSVSDTGIGIPATKLESIFEAFQQADGTTSRKYGGTGLGLTICRELAALLGGRIEVESAEGKGSTFSVYLPAVQAASGSTEAAAASAASASEQAKRDKSRFQESFIPDISISNPKLLQLSEMEDDRANLQPDDTLLLIIEEEAEFAAILLKLARQRGFKAIVASQGDQGLALAHAYKPDAILLDIQLPVLDGWSIISRLKGRPELRHIPIHIISTAEENQQGLAMGALAFWKKPNDVHELEAAFLQIESYIRRPAKSLLIVEDNPDLRNSVVAFIAHPDVNVVAVATGREALEQLASNHFDCMVLDLGLSDISGFDLLEQVKTNRKLQTLPVIIFTGKELSKQDEQNLHHYAESIVIKNVKSMERLYDETALYLHRKHADLPADKQQLIEKLHNPEAAFQGKNILLVDDDMRNIFALSSVLEGYNMNITFAQNGKEALTNLQNHPEVDLIFMDIMMPEMDGYETMREIRKIPDFEKVVIIALTARAMEEDRIKCLQAGASDYISKPINTTQLVSMLKTWLIK
ncbi:response regulator [Paenibacillus lutrae]|uniref:Circadian input-output histidine kinase CikA n=1 Tax=Paenibacillus lutrae TaxID=2078573 RepID=A0A7X3FIW7_9BACL|nr:response regulator [Paenibacillus lutrae]MVP00601.1 response regulator [Paenibacillus lutrae]